MTSPVNLSINQPSSHPTLNMSSEGICAMPGRIPRRSLSGDGTPLSSIRQKSFRGLGGMFQRTNTIDNAAATADSKTPPNRSFSFRRGCSLRKLVVDEPLDLSTSSSHGSLASHSAASSAQTPTSARQARSHRRRPTRSASGPLIRPSCASKSTVDELEALTRDLERMALALGKVENRDKILLKHMHLKPSHGLAA